jgi:hypothetical protein
MPDHLKILHQLQGRYERLFSEAYVHHEHVVWRAGNKWSASYRLGIDSWYSISVGHPQHNMDEGGRTYTHYNMER